MKQWTPKEIALLKQTYPDTVNPESLCKYFNATVSEIVNKATELRFERRIEVVIKYCGIEVTNPKIVRENKGRKLVAIPSLTGLVGYDVLVDGCTMMTNLPLEQIQPAERSVIIPVVQPNLTVAQRQEIMYGKPVNSAEDAPEVVPPKKMNQFSPDIDDEGFPTVMVNGVRVRDTRAFEPPIPKPEKKAPASLIVSGDAPKSLPEMLNKVVNNVPLDTTPTFNGKDELKEKPLQNTKTEKESNKKHDTCPLKRPITEDPTALKVPPSGEKVDKIAKQFSPAVQKAMKNLKTEKPVHTEKKACKEEVSKTVNPPNNPTSIQQPEPPVVGNMLGNKPEPVATVHKADIPVVQEQLPITTDGKALKNSETEQKVTVPHVDKKGKTGKNQLRKQWTIEEDAELRKDYPTGDTEAMSKKYGVSKDALMVHAGRLGIKKERKAVIRRAKDDEVVMSMVQGLNDNMLNKLGNDDERKESERLFASHLDIDELATWTLKILAKKLAILFTIELNNNCHYIETYQVAKGILDIIAKFKAIQAGLPEGGAIINMNKINMIVADGIRIKMKNMPPDAQQQFYGLLKLADTNERLAKGFDVTKTIPPIRQIMQGENNGG
jgi:hypothetical protein